MKDDADLNTNTNTNSNSNSMVMIRDSNDYSVFPPNNHENLQIFSNPNRIPELPSSPSSSSTLSSFSSSDSDNSGLTSPSPINSQVRRAGDFVSWMRMGLQIMRSKFLAFSSSFRNSDSERGAISSIVVPAGAVVTSCWIVMRFWCWLRKRRRRRSSRSLTRNENRLLNIIKDKDKIIAKLLHQIAEMNEILIARHKALAAKVME